MHATTRRIYLLLNRHANHAEMAALMSAAANEGRTFTQAEAERFDALARDVEEADLLIAYMALMRQSQRDNPPAKPEPPKVEWVHRKQYPTSPPSLQRKQSHRSRPRPIEACDCTLAGGTLLLGRSYLDPIPFSEMEQIPGYLPDYS
jgi:hypothetical protein